MRMIYWRLSQGEMQARHSLPFIQVYVDGECPLREAKPIHSSSLLYCTLNRTSNLSPPLLPARLAAPPPQARCSLWGSWRCCGPASPAGGWWCWCRPSPPPASPLRRPPPARARRWRGRRAPGWTACPARCRWAGQGRGGAGCWSELGDASGACEQLPPKGHFTPRGILLWRPSTLITLGNLWFVLHPRHPTTPPPTPTHTHARAGPRLDHAGQAVPD